MSRTNTQTTPHDPIDWAAALAEHGRWLRLVVLARVGDRHAVEEVMQEVAASAVSQRSPIGDREKLAPWLHRIAVNQALLYRRGRGRRHRMMARYAEHRLAEEEEQGGADALDWLLRDERAGLVRTALDRLPRRDAEILLLKYLEDWSYRELSDHLGLTLPAVQARLHRARARLRGALVATRVIEVCE